MLCVDMRLTKPHEASRSLFSSQFVSFLYSPDHLFMCKKAQSKRDLTPRCLWLYSSSRAVLASLCTDLFVQSDQILELSPMFLRVFFPLIWLETVCGALFLLLPKTSSIQSLRVQSATKHFKHSVFKEYVRKTWARMDSVWYKSVFKPLY